MRYYIQLCIIFFLSCTSEKKVQQVKEIDPANATLLKKWDYSYLFDKAEYITLETNDNCLIGNVSKVICTDSLIFVLDRKLHRVLTFNDNGIFKMQIGSIGNGPGEYLNPIDIWKSKKDNCIKVYDSKRKVILYYSLDGKYVNREKVGFYAKKIIESKEHYYGFIGTSPFGKGDNEKGVKFVMQSMIDSEVDYIYNDVNLIKEINSVLSYNPELGNVLFCESLDYHIYELKNNKITARYKLVFGNNSFPEEYVDRINKMDYRKIMQEVQHSQYVLGIDYMVELDDVLIISVLMTRKPLSLIIDKHTNECIAKWTSPLKSKYGAEGFTRPINAEGNIIYEVITPANLIYLKNQNNDIQRQIGLDQLCEGLSKASNPIIIKHHLKENITVN